MFLNCFSGDFFFLSIFYFHSFWNPLHVLQWSCSILILYYFLILCICVCYFLGNFFSLMFQFLWNHFHLCCFLNFECIMLCVPFPPFKRKLASYSWMLFIYDSLVSEKFKDNFFRCFHFCTQSTFSNSLSFPLFHLDFHHLCRHLPLFGDLCTWC